MIPVLNALGLDAMTAHWEFAYGLRISLVMQSGCHGSFLGHMDLELEGNRIVDYRHRLIEVEANMPPDPDVEEIIRQVLAPFEKELSTVVGRTATALNRATTLETTMDNFLLQVLLETTGAQLAFANGWRFGAPIIPGEITMNDLYNIIPMNQRTPYPKTVYRQ